MTTTGGGPSSQEWRLTTQQFRLFWADCDGAGFPSELCPLGVEVDVDAEMQRLSELTAVADLRARSTPMMRSAMTTLTHPRYTIAIQGIDARKPLADTSHHLRIVSAWSGSGDVVIVARQEPGPNISHGGDVVVTRHVMREWTRDLLRMLPPSSGAGSLSPDDAVPFVEIPIDVEVFRQVSPAASPVTAAGAFVHQSPSTCGSIRVQVGSEADGRRPSVLTLQYRDIVDDGRYLLIVDSLGTARGVDDATMASAMSGAVNVVRRRYEVRADAGWQ